ncbi:MAG TPA: hypothetical protein DD738_01535, partial [Ruminiclostridium sp.]|nr:hypothetical protein [Ruminiclostridium sp.]
AELPSKIPDGFSNRRNKKYILTILNGHHNILKTTKSQNALTEKSKRFLAYREKPPKTESGLMT